MTRLDIINQMLAAVGTAPLTGENTQHPSYIEADAVLSSTEFEILSSGWWFNKVTVTLSQLSDGSVILPDGALEADPVDAHSNFYWMDNKLFDPVNNTFNIGQPVKANLILERSISEMPTVARLAIQKSAKFQYYLNKDGAEPRLTAFGRASARAYAMLNKADLRNADHTVYSSPAVAQVTNLGNVAAMSLNPTYPGGRR